MATYEYDGVFVERETETPGHLKCDETDELLTLVHGASGAGFQIAESLFGTFSNGRRASLLDCICVGVTQVGLGERYTSSTQIGPNLMIVGDRWVASTDHVVREIEFSTDGIQGLSGFRNDFGSIVVTGDDLRDILAKDAERMAAIAKKNGWDPVVNRAVEIGKRPVIQYYSDNFSILEVEFESGRVEISNRVSRSSKGSEGTTMSNQIKLTIKFHEPRTVREALRSVHAAKKFFDLCIGRNQRYKDIVISLVDSDENFVRLDVHWSRVNEKAARGRENPHGTDVVADFGKRRVEFEVLLPNWMNTWSSMGTSRNRFAQSYGSNSFGPDRIVRAANMYDLLPADYAPKKRNLDDCTVETISVLKRTARALPKGVAREELLGAIGRIGNASLKDKTRHRAAILKNATGKKFDEIDFVLFQAVDCRNHYVHGGDPKFDYEANFAAFAFMTETLEFVFATSDLIQIGWDIQGWRGNSFTAGHSMAHYWIHYEQGLADVKQAAADA